MYCSTAYLHNLPLKIAIYDAPHILYRLHNMQNKTCPQNCASGRIITDGNTGEILCSGCGLVILEKIESTGPERHNSHEDYTDKSRTGGKTSLALDDMGLSTVIGSKNEDSTGKFLTSDMKNTFRRLRIWDSRSKSRSSDRSLRSAFVLLNTLKGKLTIPDTVIEDTAYLYRKALAKKLTRGGSIASLISAALYLSCKKANVPRTLNEVSEASNVNIKNLSRNVRILIENFDLSVTSYDSSDFVSRIANSLGVSERTKRGALDLLHDAKRQGLSEGKNPVAMAATSIYLSCLINKETHSQRKIASVSGISEVTVRNRAKNLVQQLTVLKNLQNIVG